MSRSDISTATTSRSDNLLIIYRTFLAFVMGYFCSQCLNVILAVAVHHLGVATAESIVLAMLCSLIFACIFVLSCYMITSLRLLSWSIAIFATLLSVLRYGVIGIS